MQNNVYVTPYFPSIFFKKEVDDFEIVKEGILEWIYNFQKNNSSYQRSNIGGWHSNVNLFENPDFQIYSTLIKKEVEYCLSQIIENLNFKISEGWININKKGDFNLTHTHPESDLSAVFWISTKGEKSGRIEFENPCNFEQNNLLSKIKKEVRDSFNLNKSHWIVPKDGVLLIFPSNIRHMVFPNQTFDDRISIAFNIKLY